MKSGGAMAEVGARVVVLGASNATLGFPLILERARALLGGPVCVLGAMGLGRSYGAWSNVLGRGLPGIVECGLWPALRASPPAPTYALVTDIGNDILYGRSVETILSWVESCLDRLGEAGAVTVLTLLPLSSLARLTALRYGLARTILYPRSRLTMAAALASAEELNRRVAALAAARGVAAVVPEASWYGIDCIHIRGRCRPAAWKEVLGCWRAPGNPVAPGSPVPPAGALPAAGSFLAGRLRLRFLRPERWAFLGHELRRQQPCLRLPDGSSVSLY